jgi:hypothetical protein
VEDVLSNYRELLQTIGRLTVENETGLFGELLVLHHFVATLGAKDAIAAWVGPTGGEHDFALSDEDIEVKTTTSEQRRHWIGGLTQLVSTGARPLWLVSLQVTSAGGSSAGLTLAEIESQTRALLPGKFRAGFQRLLADVGYHATSADLYTRKLALRTAPLALLVEDGFPRLTPQMLRRAKAATERLPEVKYAVDVTGMNGGKLTALDGFNFPGDAHG